MSQRPKTMRIHLP